MNNPVASWTLDGVEPGWAMLFDVSRVETVGAIARRIVLSRTDPKNDDDVIYAFNITIGRGVAIPCCREIVGRSEETLKATEAFRAEIVAAWAEALRRRDA